MTFLQDLHSHPAVLQEELLAAVEAEEWFTGGANQAMRFGDFPQWAENLAECVCGSITNPEACYAPCLPDMLLTCLSDMGDAACSMDSCWVTAFHYCSVYDDVL